MTVTSAIATKLVSVMNEVGAITKRGINTKQQYTYVKATDVANEVRAALIKHGVAFSFDVESQKMWEKPTSNGGMLFFCEIVARGTFTDQQTGESISGRAIGWGADSLDKAPYKAMTGALKYLLRMNALIPDEEDPEKDNEHYEAKPAPAPSQQQPTAPAKPVKSAAPPKGDLIEGVVEAISHKKTQNGGDSWGFKINGGWVNTFEAPVGNAVVKGKLYTFQTETKGKYTNIVGIVNPQELEPAPTDEDCPF